MPPISALNVVILTKTVLEKFDPKPPEVAFSKVFFHNNFKSEAASNVVSGVTVEKAGMDIRIKFGDSR